MIYKQKGVFKAPFFCNGADAVRGKENGLVQ